MNAMTRGNHAVLYVRVSTLEQAEKAYNVENQLQICKAFAEKQGFPIANCFVDPGESARSADRPQFQEMLKFCRSDNHVGYVVVQDLSRFARNNEDQARIWSQLTAMRVELRSVLEPNIDRTAVGKLHANMIGAFNQYRSDQQSELNADRTRQSIRKGRWPWRAPLGYKNVKSGPGEPNIVPDERAPLILRAFELAATGQYTRSEVLRIITAEGLRSRNGRVLDSHTFSNMLKNPVYMGVTRSKTEPAHPGLYVPIVSKEQFERVQDVLAGRRKRYVPHRKINPDFPLRGIRCTECNSPLTAYHSKGKMGTKYAYYECKKCKAVLIRAEELEKAFRHLLNKLKPRPEVVAQFPKIAARVWSQRQEQYEKQRRSLTKQLDAQRRLRDALMDRLLNGKLTETDYQQHAPRYDAEISRLETDLRALDDSKANLESFVRFAELALLNMPQVWDAASPEQKVRVRNLLFEDGLLCSPETQLSNSGKPNLFNVLTDVCTFEIGDGAP